MCSQETCRKRTTKCRSRKTQQSISVSTGRENITKPSSFCLGFCQAPFVFTKICRVLVSFCGVLAIPVLNFVDDFLFSEDQQKILLLQKFIDNLFAIVGWTFSMKDNQMGDRVKFLGFVIDTLQRKFFIPDSVCQKVKRMIDITCDAACNGRQVTIQDIQRMTGKLVSLKIAIPSVSVWIRPLYCCLPPEEEEVDNQTLVNISPEAAEGLQMVKNLITESERSSFHVPRG